jgi:hypothetical protein
LQNAERPLSAANENTSKWPLSFARKIAKKLSRHASFHAISARFAV